jgi:glutamine synthetase
MKFLGAFLLASSVSAFAPAPFHRATTALHFSRVLTSQTGKSSLDPLVIQRYDALPYPKDKVLAEYVWVDADGNLRSKTRTLPADKVSDKRFTRSIF